MANNLPPGVRVTDIPGNRPEDVRHEQVMERAYEELPFRFAELLSLMRKIDTTDSAEEFASACNNIVSLFEPTQAEREAGQKWGNERDRRWVFEDFLSGIEDAGTEASYYMDPPEPEYDSDDF